MLTKAQHTNDQNERNKILDDIITLLGEINREELVGIIDNKTKTEFGNLYSTSKKLLEDPQSFYEKDLLEVKKYIEAAKLDVIKQKSPRENVLVALNYLNSAVDKGFFPADAKKYKLDFFEIQLQSLINNTGNNSAALLFELRGWISLALKELNLSIDELGKEMKLSDLTDSILPPGYKSVDDSYDVKFKKNQAVWFRMYPQTVKSSSGMEFCLVPPGKFSMGNKKSKFETEKPAHEVVLDTPFYLGKFELMVGEFREFARKHLDLTLFDNNDVVVTGINYVSALRFCNWLSKKHDLKSAYICSAEDDKKSSPEDWKVDLNTSGYRLPTEAEWEYVAKYSSNDTQEVSLLDTPWFGDETGGILLRGNSETLTENKIKPNYLGIYCMRGNALELVSDWFGAYENKPAVNPVRQLDSSVKSRHIGRGGHVGSSDVEISTTYRKRIHPEIGKPKNLGMRLVIPLRFEKIIANN